MSDLLRVYLDPAEISEKTGYPFAWERPWEKLIEAGRALARDESTNAALGLLDDGTLAIKDYIRERDGHRCLRCHHPYRQGQHGNGHWSPCDTKCLHRGPARMRRRDDEAWAETELGYPAGGILYEREDALECESAWRILTVHHLNSIKYDCRWWNLVSLCQRCHLTIQGKVYMDRPWTKPHSEWFKPFVAGFYAWKYLDEEISQEEALARMDELLDLELTQEALF